MANQTATPRDKLDELIAYARRAIYHGWLVAIIAVVGAALTLLVLLVTSPRYLSEAKLLYDERISTSLLQGRDVVQQTKNLGNRYGELLMARQQLAKVVAAFDLFPDIARKEGVNAAIDELQKLVTFRIRDAGSFHIQFVSPDPKLSQAVTQMLTTLLIEEDTRLRRQSASATKDFLLEEKAKVNQEMAERLRALAAFLAEHPEFAEDTAQGMQAATGAGVRAAAHGKIAAEEQDIPGAETMDPRLLALERQRRRLRTRIAAPEQTNVKLDDTLEQRAAKDEVREARRELDESKRRLERLSEQLQPAHPDVVRQKARVVEATLRLQRAEAAVPPAVPRPPPVDREALEQELQKVERQIAATRDRLRKDGEKNVPEEAPSAEPENWVVALETEFARLSQQVEETRRRVNKLDASLSAAEITASQQMAEEGAVLTVIDPANLPSRPQGKSRTLLLLVGVAVSLLMGSALALALALVDDRIYTASDLAELGIAPVAVAIPRPTRKKRRG